MMTNHITFAQFCSAVRRKGTLALCVALCTMVLNLTAHAQKPTIITFDAPGAGTGPGQGTQGNGINPAGAITGFYLDANNVFHGFLRTPNGAITGFDAPGAGSTAGSFQGTQAYSINPEGTIVGLYLDANNVYHGFLRARDGNFTTYEAPGADTTANSFNGTFAANINPAGTIAGDYVDADNVGHGYLRAPDGTFTTFDAPGAGTGPGQGTFTGSVDCINPAGAMAGTYSDASNVAHGYVRASDGTITTFDVPGAGTNVSGINPAGTISGISTDASNVAHGYVRASDGTITTFDVPGAGTGSGQGTFAENINAPGAVTGQYIDPSGVNHGLLRATHGTLTTFDVPDAGTGSGQGTVPVSNNPADAIAGIYLDANGVAHGFLRTP
jgi:hypothetical protein